jgi:hypothetical protein
MEGTKGSGSYRIIFCSGCNKFQAMPAEYKKHKCQCGKNIVVIKVRTYFTGPLSKAQQIAMDANLRCLTPTSFGDYYEKP